MSTETLPPSARWMRPSFTAAMIPLASPRSNRAAAAPLFEALAFTQALASDSRRRVFDIGSGKYAPYVSSRLTYLSLSADIDDFGTRVVSGAHPELLLSVARRATATVPASGFQGNIGGGVPTKLSPRVNLDVGFTVGAIRFGQAELKSGGRTIQVSEEVTGTGQNLVLRAGLAIGLGGAKAKANAPATTRPATRR